MTKQNKFSDFQAKKQISKEIENAPEVSIIIAVSDAKSFLGCCPAIFCQSYKNTDYIIVDNIPDSDDNAFSFKKSKKTENPEKINFRRSIKSYSKFIKIEVIPFESSAKFSFETPSRNELLLFGAKNATGKYLAFADENTVWNETFIEDSITAISKGSADFSTGDIAIIWKDNSSKHYPQQILPDKDILKTPFENFIQNAGILNGLYTFNNKVIEKVFWDKAALKLEAFYADENKAALSNGDLLLSSVLWGECEKYVCVPNSFSVSIWTKEDGVIESYMQNRNTADIINEIKATFDFVLELSDDVKTKKECMKFFEQYAERFLWRASWSLPSDFKEKLANMMKLIEIKDYSSNCGAAFFKLASPCGDLNELFTDVKIPAGQPVSDKNIKIYVSMHKPSYVPQDNKFIVPIQVGADCDLLDIIDNPFDANILRDNKGENISDKNRRYHDLTAQYYAWKNEHNSDYFGFFHFDRYLAFDRFGTKPAVKMIASLNEKTMEDINFDEKNIMEACSDYDIIVPFEENLIWDNHPISLYERWGYIYEKEEIDCLLKIVAQKHFDFFETLMEVIYDSKQIMHNIFVMKKDFFNEYFPLVYSILSELDELIDSQNYNVKRYASFTHIACILLTAFVRHKQEQNNELSVLYTSYVNIENTVPAAKVSMIDVAGKKKHIPVCICCNDGYIKYTAVLLQSIYENANPDYFYDIVILTRDTQPANKRICIDMFEKIPNFSLRFFDVTRNFENYTTVFIDRQISLEAYYRILIPEVFPDYEKVLYLDVDMVANDDVAKLFDEDITGKYAGVVRDLDFITSVNQDIIPDNQADSMKYLKFKNWDDYFNSGLILYNLLEVRNNFTVRQMFDLALSRNWKYHDQDTLNYFFNGNLHYFEEKWNIFWYAWKSDTRSMVHGGTPEKVYKIIQSAIKNFSIVHYTGATKWWHAPAMDFKSPAFNLAWKYARKSPYYEVLLEGLNKNQRFPNSWFCFRNCNEGGIPFLKINLLEHAWTSSYIKIDFVYLSNHSPAASNSLFITASRIPDNNIIHTHIINFEFDKDIFEFKSNIGYQIVGNTMIIWCKYWYEYTGFSYKLSALESRSIEKPTIDILNKFFINECVALPQNIKWGK